MIEGVLGSALWTIDYILYAASLVSSDRCIETLNKFELIISFRVSIEYTFTRVQLLATCVYPKSTTDIY